MNIIDKITNWVHQHNLCVSPERTVSIDINPYRRGELEINLTSFYDSIQILIDWETNWIVAISEYETVCMKSIEEYMSSYRPDGKSWKEIEEELKINIAIFKF